MAVYAGIDEAGYGPMFGPMVIGCAVLTTSSSTPDSEQPADFWQLLSRAVCRSLTGRKGRIAVNDSKKLHTPAAGIGHLERGVLSFAHIAGLQPICAGQLLDVLGETAHRQLDHLPWYRPGEHAPWQPLPTACDPGELAISRNMLLNAAGKAGVNAAHLAAAVVFEDQFNRMTAATRSKASVSFTFVARHLLHIWQQFGPQNPLVVVDRQSGRMHYRELLAMTFPQADLLVQEESPTISAYRIRDASRCMTVRFQVDAERGSLPTALASMISKYLRELMMARFQAWFTRHAPHIKPTAGYALDARRFRQEITPLLGSLGIEPHHLFRRC